MDPRHQLAARLVVRYVGDQEGVADPPEVGHQEHHDDCIEGTPGDTGPVPREGHDQHYPGEGEAGEARHDPHVQLRRVVEYPRVAIALN